MGKQERQGDYSDDSRNSHMSEQYRRLVDGKLVGTPLMIEEAIEAIPITLDNKVVGHVCVWGVGLFSMTHIIKDEISGLLAIIQLSPTITADRHLFQLMWAALYSRSAGSHNGKV